MVERSRTDWYFLGIGGHLVVLALGILVLSLLSLFNGFILLFSFLATFCICILGLVSLDLGYILSSNFRGVINKTDMRFLIRKDALEQGDKSV